MRCFAAATTCGPHRAINEDAVGAMGALLVDEAAEPVTRSVSGCRALFAVADGVGSRGHGARASRAVISGLLAEPAPQPEPEACREAVFRAALALHALVLALPETAGMATTVAGVTVAGRFACWFNVGDSRVYRLRADRLECLSVDDTAKHGDAPGRVLTRAIGGTRMLAPVVPHAGRIELAPDDRLLLVTDGIWHSMAHARKSSHPRCGTRSGSGGAGTARAGGRGRRDG